MTVKWTKRAESSYRSILDYISSEFGSQTAEVFKQKTIDFLDLLAKFPEVGSLEIQEKNIRGFQMTKPTRVFYRVKGDIIILLTFFDVRQSPDKKIQ